MKMERKGEEGEERGAKGREEKRMKLLWKRGEGGRVGRGRREGKRRE